MLRPLFVTGSLVHGGAERHTITVMNRLVERGHECHAVYVKNDPSQLERIRPGERGTVRCLNAGSYLDMSAVSDFADHLASLRPSVVVAANGYALMYASLALLRSGWRAPLMVVFHTTALYGIKEQVKMLTDRLFFWTATCAVFVCAGQRRYWRRRAVCARRNELIYNGVDTAHFSDRSTADERGALRNTFGFEATDYVIGISAVLRPEKNHVQLLAAVAALRQRGIPARLLIIGDGPLRSLLDNRIRAMQLEPVVRITGFQQDVRPSITICDVMVLCSIAVETFSLAALEAMAMGKPVVHADLGGAAEMIVPGRNGFLFPVGDTDALVDRLALLADKSVASRMGRAAIELVEERFSEHAMVDRYEELLADVCRGSRLMTQIEDLRGT